ncbi:hypothetical protein GWI33_016182 [Rhynchophorus ferrugineus]|uniref:Uncharacterized protein n=1 Tax=Rhynchophorus ferrugineus TaxID=354439 RepID=A0A834I3Z7_RHYFE|nr:hypothetical protein GWI33_016182 [Rhynchophorus ferrugineus]
MSGNGFRYMFSPREQSRQRSFNLSMLERGINIAKVIVIVLVKRFESRSFPRVSRIPMNFTTPAPPHGKQLIKQTTRMHLRETSAESSDLKINSQHPQTAS